MKKLFTIILTFISFSISAQQFDGVPISGTTTNAIAKFKAKGYVLSKIEGDAVIMKGKIAAYPIELIILSTPKTKQVYKVVAFLEKDISWKSLKSNYFRFKDIFTDKYGEAESDYEYFTDPYYEGDGYELQAVRLEKCTYSSYWFDVMGMNVAVEISKYEQIRLAYENATLVKVKQRESAEIEAKAF
jgi:hypothetical protein